MEHDHRHRAGRLGQARSTCRRWPKLSRKGATSENIAYDKNGDLKEISVTIYEVKNGKWEMVETMVSQAN